MSYSRFIPPIPAALQGVGQAPALGLPGESQAPSSTLPEGLGAGTGGEPARCAVTGCANTAVADHRLGVGASILVCASCAAKLKSGGQVSLADVQADMRTLLKGRNSLRQLTPAELNDYLLLWERARKVAPQGGSDAQANIDTLPDGTIEIITGRERRRRWGIAEKLTIVSESHEAGACVAAVAARHDICPSLLHGWRRLARQGLGRNDLFRVPETLTYGVMTGRS